jgi:hypothetical protein
VRGLKFRRIERHHHVQRTEIKVRLIEQMAHRWRYDQMEKIAAFLKDSLPDVTILM